MSIESSLFWLVAEIAVNLLEVTVILWYLHVKLNTGHTRFFIPLLGGVFLLGVVTLFNFLTIPDGIRLCVIVVCFVAYSMYAYKEPLGRRIFQPLLAFIILGISDTLVFALLSFIPGNSADLMTRPTVFRLQSLIASKILFASILFFMANYKDIGQIGRHLWFLFLIVPVTSGVVLHTLIQYEIRLDDAKAVPLLIATIGLFVINMAILVLLQVVSINSKKILNQEMLLQQNDIQSKYFAEINSTNDSLRGFRHDLNNHLQVLHGYMSIGNYDKAEAYLNEIGNFMTLTDTVTQTGHALLDAVIGTKITHARKLNIKPDVSLQMPADLPLMQMELCSVLSNILDNAIEACERIADGSMEKEFSLKIDSFAGHMRILLKNTAMLGPNQDLEKLTTAKKGPGHGIGLSNVKRIVSSNDGQMQITYDENLFSVLILLPLKN